MGSSGGAIWGPGVGPAPLSDEDRLRRQVEAFRDVRGGRWVVYPYCISLGLVSFRRSSGLTFIPEGGGRLLPAVPYLLMSLALGWWGIPWGIFWTVECIVRCLQGGVDVTPLVDPARAATATTGRQARAAAAPIASGFVPDPANPVGLAITGTPAERAAADAGGLTRALVGAGIQDHAAQNLADVAAGAAKAGDQATLRGIVAMLCGARGDVLEPPPGADIDVFLTAQLDYMTALAGEVGSLLRSLLVEPGGAERIPALFEAVADGLDAPWVWAMIAIERNPGWMLELAQAP
jgi:hypothetical protein